jgi:hypothetical protein
VAHNGSQAEPAAKKSHTDYEAVLRLHIRPVLGTKLLCAITQFGNQSVYAQ